MRRLMLLGLVLALVLGCSSGSDSTTDTQGLDDTGSREGDITGSDTTGSDTLPDPVDGTGTPDETAPDSEEVVYLPYGFLTYNAGLAHNFVPYAAERRDSVIAALAEEDAQFVCLQEVWEVDDVAALQAGLAEAYPHQFYLDTTDLTTGEPACTQDETDPLLACVNEFCAETDDLTGCVMDNCVDPFLGTSAGCQNCLAANISKPTVEEIVEACLTGSAALSYEARNGLLLLGKEPFVTTDSKEFKAFLLRRVALHAEVETELGPLHLFCTHLTAPLSEVSYGGEYADWETEQAEQINDLIAFADSKAGDDPKVIMGDMNCGPEAEGIVAEFPDNYALFGAAGYADPFAEQEPPDCTWCDDNPLVGSTGSHILDHVFVRDLPEIVTGYGVQRVLDQVVTIETDDGPMDSTLSDHYGIYLFYP